VDLSWDAIARFGADDSYALPRPFFADFVEVAADECRHFRALAARLEATGSAYGAFPAHDGCAPLSFASLTPPAARCPPNFAPPPVALRAAAVPRCLPHLFCRLDRRPPPARRLWESAGATAGSLPARLAVEHCVHEARGLDVLPATVAKFRAGGDAASADLLQDLIYPEEVSHCAAGVRWLRHLHAQATASATAAAGGEAAEGDSLQPWAAEAASYATVEAWFHTLVRRFMYGKLKPPFNEEARAAAGFGPEWYLPLAEPPAAGKKAAAAAAAGGATGGVEAIAAGG